MNRLLYIVLNGRAECAFLVIPEDDLLKLSKDETMSSFSDGGSKKKFSGAFSSISLLLMFNPECITMLDCLGSRSSSLVVAFKSICTSTASYWWTSVFIFPNEYLVD